VPRESLDTPEDLPKEGPGQVTLGKLEHGVFLSPFKTKMRAHRSSVRPGRVLSRDQLVDLTRGREAVPFDRSVDSQISRLRRKIESDPSRPALIKTVRSGGYVFTPVVERA
jgi:hypothetical protein